MVVFYDRQGHPMEDVGAWERLLKDPSYRRVAETTTPEAWISTVWLGAAHGTKNGSPIIFETMVFRRREGFDELHDLVLGSSNLPESIDVARYTTEAEAVAGHAAMVRKWLDKQADSW